MYIIGLVRCLIARLFLTAVLEVGVALLVAIQKAFVEAKD